MKEKRVIIKTALTSRILLTLLQYISNTIIPDHDADAFRYPKSPENGLLDNVIVHLFGGFLRWDGQYFMHIARYGYSYEHTMAFFPLYPILVRFLTSVLSHFIPFINLDSLTLLVFLCINILCFILSALCLYELTVFILNKDLAYKATILFCYNPASVFFSAPYTESIFSYLTFKSMLNCVLLYKKYCDNCLQSRIILYIIPICLSTLTRSNGILNIGFLVYIFMCLYFREVKTIKQISDKLLCSVKFSILIASLVFICIIPFILFQFYCYQMYCKDFATQLPDSVLEHPELDDFVLPGTFSRHNQSWCFKKIPLAYSYVQSYYWKVGFLKYYEFKQIPNFLLASPVVYIVLNGAFKFFKQAPKKLEELFNFSLTPQKYTTNAIKYKPAMIVFVIHAAVLTIFCVLNINVQVTTRMLCSASPILYWFAAHYISNLSWINLYNKLVYGPCCVKEYCILCYFMSYLIVGTIMFCNFLPWT